MNIWKRTHDELIGAAVDGEIGKQELTELLQDPDVARRVDELRQISSEIKLAYSDLADVAPVKAGSGVRHNVAAGLLLLVAGSLLGFFLRDISLGPTNHLILHVTQDTETSMMTAIDVIERNLANGVSVDLVAQRQGVKMLATDSPVAERLVQLAAGRGDFVIFACAGTLEKLRVRDAEPRLIAGTRTDVYAIDQLSHGYQNRWRYERL